MTKVLFKMGSRRSPNTQKLYKVQCCFNLPKVKYQHSHRGEYNPSIPDSGTQRRIVLEVSGRFEHNGAHTGFNYLSDVPGVTDYQQRKSGDAKNANFMISNSALQHGHSAWSSVLHPKSPKTLHSLPGKLNRNTKYSHV